MKFSRNTKFKGFTLIELMVALAIMGVLMAYAIPAYNNFSQRQALSNETNSLIGDLNFARNLAIDKGSLVTVASASGSDWEAGWTITLTLPGGGTQDVRTKQQIAGNITVTETGGFGTVIYDNLGAISPTSQAISLDIQNAPDYPNYILLRVLPSGIISSSRTL